jgi:hypothetical protein
LGKVAGTEITDIPAVVYPLKTPVIPISIRAGTQQIRLPAFGKGDIPQGGNLQAGKTGKVLRRAKNRGFRRLWGGIGKIIIPVEEEGRAALVGEKGGDSVSPPVKIPWYPVKSQIRFRLGNGLGPDLADRGGKQAVPVYGKENIPLQGENLPYMPGQRPGSKGNRFGFPGGIDKPGALVREFKPEGVLPGPEQGEEVQPGIPGGLGGRFRRSITGGRFRDGLVTGEKRRKEGQGQNRKDGQLW